MYRVLFPQTAEIYEELIRDNIEIEVVVNASPPRERCFSIKFVDNTQIPVQVQAIVELIDLDSPFSELKRMDDNGIIDKIKKCIG